MYAEVKDEIFIFNINNRKLVILETTSKDIITFSTYFKAYMVIPISFEA